MSRSTRSFLQRRSRPVLRRGLYPALGRYLPAKAITKLVQASGQRFRKRIYTPLVTLWGMISQALSDNASDRAAIHRLAAWFGVDASAKSGGYCAARQRLPLRLLEDVAKYVAGKAPQHQRVFKDRGVCVLDGCNVTLADTKENQDMYPQPPGQTPGCGFPVIHFAALMDHATGCVVDMVFGSLREHDARLARPLWDHLKPGDILLIDRGFSSYALMSALGKRGVHVVARQHQRRKNSSEFSDTQRLVVSGFQECWEWWERPSKVPDWIRAELPEKLRVRVIHCHLPNGGILILNTLLSEEDYSAEELCELYRTRWRIETMFADLKVTLGLDNVLPKSPASAHRLLWAHALAYNLLCRLLLDVAKEHRVPRCQLSLKGAADALAAGVALGVKTLKEAWAWVARRIAQDRQPERPDRLEPRVRKRRPKQPPLMTKPRHQLVSSLDPAALK